MKLHFFGPKFLACLLLLLPSLLFAQARTGVTVDCTGATPGAFTSLSQAIFDSPDHTTFAVTGTCNENGITIQNRNDLVIIGNPTATIQTLQPDLPLITVTSSQSIQIANVTMNGGQGLQISNSSGVSILSSTIENSGSFGINSSKSQVLVIGGSVTASTRTGVVTFGGTVELDGVTISNNGRLGISAATTHLIMQDGNGLPPIVSNNGIAGIQLFNSSQGDFVDLQITSNAGNNFGLEVFTNSAVVMQGGSVSGNTGIGVTCGSTTHCEFLQTQINGNSGGGIQITNHSELDLDGGVQITGNTGVGVLIDQHSAFASGGGNTISSNTGDGLIVNALSTLDFVAPDTITATAGNLALNCNNGSLVTGDISTYKPKKCGTAFQAVPIH
jgi:Right handed beta helix region